MATYVPHHRPLAIKDPQIFKKESCPGIVEPSVNVYMKTVEHQNTFKFR